MDRAEDRARFQGDIDSLAEWSRTWQLHFNTDKFKIMHLGKHNAKQVYSMDGQVLSTTEAEKDISVTVQDNLKPSRHCTKVAAKANGMLGQLS